MGHALRSNGLLYVKASQLRVFQSGLKTDRGATTMVHMTSSRRLHRVKVKDGQVDAMGCIGTFYLQLYCFLCIRP
jgi:hypothetical protein